jgi:hypothetical protein
MAERWTVKDWPHPNYPSPQIKWLVAAVAALVILATAIMIYSAVAPKPH